MDIAAPVIPGHSIAGIPLGDEISSLSSELKKEGIAFTVSSFSNAGMTFTQLSIQSGVVTVVADTTGRIVRLTCGPGYLGKYRGVLHPGMTVKQICDNSSKQLVIHGMLVIDKEFGAFFDIPESYEGVPCDDIDYVSQLPQNMVLNELHVKDREWWR